MDPIFETLLDTPAVAAATAWARAASEQTLSDQMALTAIPAPPFKEGERALAVASRFRDVGLADVRRDGIGNVLGVRAGDESLAPLIVSAHLDTVFGEDVPVRVTRDGDRLLGPGISDDGRGLAVMLAVARALAAGGVRTRRPVLFAATVGEEGLGDLRGAKHLVGPDGAGRGAAGFITIDGAGLDRVVTRGLGSRRFRVRVHGPGGHSWLDRGLASPIHALGRAVEVLTSLALPTEPETTLTVARWGGGTSINAIPQEAWLEVDCRSESDAHLERIEAALRSTVEAAVAEEMRARRGSLDLAVERIGLRPAGFTDEASLLVRATFAASAAVGARCTSVVSSTDANAAMAEGIPAVSFGGGGEAGLAHTTEEWYRDVGGAEGLVRALWTVVLAASG